MMHTIANTPHHLLGSFHVLSACVRLRLNKNAIPTAAHPTALRTNPASRPDERADR